MAANNVELKELQMPGAIQNLEGGAHYEQYKQDGVYEYPVMPNGRPNKKQVKIAYNSGDAYEGSLRRGKPNGAGTYTWKDGGVFKGNIKKGVLIGNGEYRAANGDVYVGNFKKSKYSGNGKYTWADGSSFEGNFKKGRIISGQYTDVNGNVYTCKYKYKLNGERKSGILRLVRFGENSAQTQSATKKKKTQKENDDKSGLTSKDKRLIASIRKSVRSAEFKNLYSGAEGKSEKSEKRLIAILNFFSNSDVEQIDRIFKTSQLYDPTKGREHVTNMISGVVKRSQSYASNLKDRAKQNASSKNKTAQAVR